MRGKRLVYSEQLSSVHGTRRALYQVQVRLGRGEQLEGKIQQRYGVAKDQVRRNLDDWFSSQRFRTAGSSARIQRQGKHQLQGVTKTPHRLVTGSSFKALIQRASLTKRSGTGPCGLDGAR